MRAMVLEHTGGPLTLQELPAPRPSPRQVAIAVSTCGVCRTDLHILDGELDAPALPLIPGHQVVGRIVELGAEVAALGLGLRVGQRVGVPWLGSTCQSCQFCCSGQENLCAEARFTGYQLPGGYAEHTVADARYCFPIPDAFDDLSAAPLLCAGLIGYRSLRMCGSALRLGIYGIGAAAHIIMQIARYEGRAVYAFTRDGDAETQDFARGLGATWAGGSSELPSEPLDAAILFAPVGGLVPQALKAIRPGGVVVCGGIHMSDIPSFPYHLLWMERSVRSVANLTRRDAEEFLPLAAAAGVKTTVHPYPLERAGDALEDLRHGRFDGAAVLTCEP